MVLVDNTVLSNFSLVDQIQLLITFLGGQVTTTTPVIEEFKKGIERGRLPEIDIDWLKAIEMETEELRHFQELLNRVNVGEASCLAVAASRNGLILTDDRDARKLAAQLKVPVSGTIGILLNLVQINNLSFTEANNILGQMIVKGYHSPVQNLEEL